MPIPGEPPNCFVLSILDEPPNCFILIINPGWAPKLVCSSCQSRKSPEIYLYWLSIPEKTPNCFAFDCQSQTSTQIGILNVILNSARPEDWDKLYQLNPWWTTCIMSLKLFRTAMNVQNEYIDKIHTCRSSCLMPEMMESFPRTRFAVIWEWDTTVLVGIVTFFSMTEFMTTEPSPSSESGWNKKIDVLKFALYFINK